MKRSILILFILAIALSGCNLASNVKAKHPVQAMKMAEASYDKMASAPAPAKPLSDSAKTNAQQVKMTRKIIYSANLKLEVIDVAKSIDQIKSIAKQNKGYIQSSNVSKTENSNKYGEIVFRVEPANLDNAMGQVKKLGDVLDESLIGDDVTQEYYDIAGRLKNSKMFEKRLLKLLETKTTKVKDILEVELELDRVRTNIEQLQGTINYYNNLVGLATITVRLYEKGTIVPNKFNVLQPLIDTTMEAFGAFFETFGMIVVLLFAYLPWVLFLAVLIFILVKIGKRISKKN